MKIAYTINGLIGGFSGKNSSGSTDDDQLLVLKYIGKLLDKYIKPFNNVDFFIFSWHTDFMEEFNNRISPVMCKLLPQVDFDLPLHLRGDNEGRVIAHKSRWFGFKEVMNLVSEYEKEYGFQYDLVVNARFDICWNKPFHFKNLNVDKFHIPIHPDMPTYGWPDGGVHTDVEMLDHIFASRSDWMKGFATMYDFLDEYTLPGQCPQWKTISHHFLMVWHLRKLGLLREDLIEKPFSNWHEKNPNIIGGSNDVYYDIFRYRKLTREEVINETKNYIL